MSLWFITHPFQFKHPFNCQIVGPTMCGKTFLLKEILKYKSSIISKPPTNIIYCYKLWQPCYDEMKLNDKSIVFHEGLYDMSLLQAINTNLIILDDLMVECNKSQDILNLFTVGTHHSNTSVFFLTQNIFSKGPVTRDISLNTKDLILFLNPRDQLQMQILARQAYGKNSKWLVDSFLDATKKPYGYLHLNFSPETENRNRVQTGILPKDFDRIIYTSRESL
jgi:hypothetical protein